MHKVDDSIGPIELVFELHTVIAVRTYANDRADFAIRASGSFDTGQARGARWVNRIGGLKLGQGRHWDVDSHGWVSYVEVGCSQ